MAPDGRRILAGQQREILAALTGCGSLPAGFDGERVNEAGRQLIEKRWRNVCRIQPALARALGVDGPPLFASYASVHPLPAAGAHGDAVQFWEMALHGTALTGTPLRLKPAVAHGRTTWRRK